MTIKTFIKKAIEGQQDNLPRHKVIRANEYWVTLEDANGTEYTQALPIWLLNKESWQAVGKVEGWKGIQWHSIYEGFRPSSWTRRYHYEMHRMIDALYEGKTIEEYLQTL
jgi:hypothetical protein